MPSSLAGQGYLLRTKRIYLDDIIAYSPGFDTHLEHLDHVFQCKFLQMEVVYLGHVVSKAGIATDPEKTAAVRDWPRPETVSQVRSFLGFAGYLMFCPLFF